MTLADSSVPRRHVEVVHRDIRARALAHAVLGITLKHQAEELHFSVAVGGSIHAYPNN